ncbi:hypothetical protein MKX50_06995 [Paenibacillus sp. FSL W8-0186]|uniref:YqkK n=1 Tax=Paenibacillus woosongensis TaxID=307580 RepID=A0ABQ4MMP6_9BACL|nr:hypothetical protein [Paenibacillus woosongensis]GIP57271.1 hypothetical protein J15TS10_10850 [Paenibacillus woosongensis]
MAKSKAKRMRDKLTREGRRNPELGRSPFAAADLRTRRTKTKQELLNQSKHKQKNLISYYGDDGSFLLARSSSACHIYEVGA